ncbi:Protein MON2 [Grifola frondosa]|uniref:Protein MON2 homolog n=1 Tax=Grifola frondosa TaxID=5627 RepID=A0A1C7M866_GRIFR|nr:Protein MON2 [Grifola frondosa]
MSSLAFLVTELQSLASETRRKHPDVREAAENLDGPQSDDLLRPVFMGCATKNAKVVAISLGSLQRLIALKAVPQSAVPLIITTMSDCMNQGVDIQLRILQTLLSLITNFPAVHGQLLGDALLLCFKLQESRIAVVSSTAAATLRQLVMFVVDKVVDEDRRDDIEPEMLGEVTLPNGTTKMLGPSAQDAFAVFEDLCLLANTEHPRFLKLESLRKTFALELIESVLTNYHDLFRKHTELLMLLQHHLCPLVLKSLSDRPSFPLTLRSTRVVFLLLKQFSLELKTESEGIADTRMARAPLWMRVLAMEIMRGLCSDAELIRNVWDRYDAEETGSKVFTSLITALKRLVTEKPALLGVGSQMFGVGVSLHTSSSADGGYALDVGSVAGMVATAASATVSGVASMITTEAGLSVQGSAMKLQCIDQLDKADSPPIPESYIYLLGVQCLVSLCEGLAIFTAPLYNSIMVQKPRAAGEPVTVHDMVENGWPALLAALSFVISTNLSDELFVDVLASYQALTTVAGMLALSTPRDAFFTSLARLAIPTRVVSSLDSYAHAEPSTPRTAASTISENFGLSLAGSNVQAPGLSERNMACLKVLVASALFLGGSLGDSWFDILEALQNADYVLTMKGVRTPMGKRATIGSGSLPGSRAASGSQTVSQMGSPSSDAESLEHAIQRLFDASKNLDDGAFRAFVSALCRLSAAMIGMQSDADESTASASESREELTTGPTLSPMTEPAHRRRVSGIHLARTLRSGDFGISKLGGVATLNTHRLIYRSPDIAWDPITSHLLSVICHPAAPATIRIQACPCLDDILSVVPRNISTTGDLQPKVQRRVLDVLAQQVIPESTAMSNNSTNVELRRMGLETLHQILQSSGHTLLVGWETIFEMLSSVCKVSTPPIPETTASSLNTPEPSRHKPPPLGYTNEKGYASLVKIAFQSLTLVCDSLSSLSPEHLRLCISTLGQFGRQADTNIALTAAESLLWGVSDSIQAKRKDVEKEPEYSALWMFLLLEVLGLCTDGRPEFGDMGRVHLEGDLSFACMTAAIRQRSPLPPDTPDPSTSLPDLQWDESKILALQSIGSIFHDFLTTKIMRLESFTKAWAAFVGHIRDSWLHDNRTISATALRCMDKAVQACSTARRHPRAADNGSTGNGMAIESGSPIKPFTQESLMAYVDVIRSMRTVSRKFRHEEWSLERLTRLMSILKGVLTYPSSPDFRPDIDSLSPVQAVVMEAIDHIDLSAPGVTSLILRDLSEYATLPFLAAFDIQTVSTPPISTPPISRQVRPGQSRVTYIAVAKKTLPHLVDLFLRFKEEPIIYIDGTLEAIFSAYAIPIKMKYELKECGPQIRKLQHDIPEERIEGIWRQVVETFRGGILADCSTADNFPLDVQESEENFDLSLVASLEIDVVPYLGDPSVPDYITMQLAKVLQQGSRLRDAEEYLPPSPSSLLDPAAGFHSPESSARRISHDFEKIETFGDTEIGVGTTENGRFLPRERFSYWCFDLLFLICSDTAKDQIPSRRRISTLCISSLLERCRLTLVGYVADESLRGNLPFPRAREEELLYVLRKLLALQLWPGTLWAALSDSPSQYCVEQPSIVQSLEPSQLIADAVKRSTKAHLFHFYPILCEIVSIPRKTPSMGGNRCALDTRI